ncbi:hypothetical protein L0152_07180 [bacterium]|nr:hypothetical protein [bacterium]
MKAFSMIGKPETVMESATIAAAEAKKKGYVPWGVTVQAMANDEIYFCIGWHAKARDKNSVFRASKSPEDYAKGILWSPQGWKDSKVIANEKWFFGERFE